MREPFLPGVKISASIDEFGSLRVRVHDTVTDRYQALIYHRVRRNWRTSIAEARSIINFWVRNERARAQRVLESRARIDRAVYELAPLIGLPGPLLQG